MSNVILFNLTTVLFGVASALYLGALYAKNEKISGVRHLGLRPRGRRFHRGARGALVRVVPDGDRAHPGDEPLRVARLLRLGGEPVLPGRGEEVPQPHLRRLRDADRLLHDGLRRL